MALVTGGGGGIGIESARALGADGYAIAIVGRSTERLEAARESLHAEVADVSNRRGDVREEGEIDTIVGAVERDLGPIDVVVHAAGVCAALGPTWEVATANWRADVETGLVGALVLVRRVVPGMVARRRGRVIALNSYAAVRPAPHQSAYAAGKAGLASLVESLDQELEGTGVRAFSVTPGFVWTEMTSAMAETLMVLYARREERRATTAARRRARGPDPRGDADALSGGSCHALDDVDDLLARVGEIEADDLYAPRLRRLAPPGET